MLILWWSLFVGNNQQDSAVQAILVSTGDGLRIHYEPDQNEAVTEDQTNVYYIFLK